jgi:hypothetical protein
MTFDRRVARIKELVDVTKISDSAQAALDAFSSVSSLIQRIRNGVIHAIVVDDPTLGKILHLRSKGHSYTKAQIFETEETTNYAAHAALSLLYALDTKSYAGAQHPLPAKPVIPKFLLSPDPSQIRRGQPLSPRPQS